MVSTDRVLDIIFIYISIDSIYLKGMKYDPSSDSNSKLFSLSFNTPLNFFALNTQVNVSISLSFFLNSYDIVISCFKRRSSSYENRKSFFNSDLQFLHNQISVLEGLLSIGLLSSEIWLMLIEFYTFFRLFGKTSRKEFFILLKASPKSA